jgi:GNAT superfamily N-acetyltransferase
MEITGWQRENRLWLRATCIEFLRVLEKRGGDLLPTTRNADFLCELGYAGSERGEPCLVGFIDDTPVAWILWCAPSPILDMKWRTMNAIGSYTEPSSRSQGIAHHLRKRAVKMTKRLGYQRISGPVAMSNRRGHEEFIGWGAWPTSVQWELHL